MKFFILVFFAFAASAYPQEGPSNGADGRPDINAAVKAEQIKQRDYLAHHLFASQDDFHQTVAAFNQKIRAMYEAAEGAKMPNRVDFDDPLIKQAEESRDAGDFSAAVTAYEQAIDRALERFTENPEGREGTLFLACFRAVATTVIAPKITDAALKARLFTKSLHALDVLAERSPGWNAKIVTYRRNHLRQELSSTQ